MTSERMARLMGDPPYRLDACRDVLEQVAQNRAEHQERATRDPDWSRTGRFPKSPYARARALWELGYSIEQIQESTHLPIGRIDEIVSVP